MKKFNILDWICLILLIIGGLDAGIFGVSGSNFFPMIFGSTGFLIHLVYIIMGLSALYMIYFIFRRNKS